MPARGMLCVYEACYATLHDTFPKVSACYWLGHVCGMVGRGCIRIRRSSCVAHMECARFYRYHELCVISCTPVHGKAQCSPAHNQSINGPMDFRCALGPTIAPHTGARRNTTLHEMGCSLAAQGLNNHSLNHQELQRVDHGVADVDAGSSCRARCRERPTAAPSAICRTRTRGAFAKGCGVVLSDRRCVFT